LETFGLGRDSIVVDLAEFEQITLEAVGKVAPKLRFKLMVENIGIFKVSYYLLLHRK